MELETAHRFEKPLDLGESPRRVFLCCDPGWPEREVQLFRRVFDAAVAAGWSRWAEPDVLERIGVLRDELSGRSSLLRRQLDEVADDLERTIRVRAFASASE